MTKTVALIQDGVAVPEGVKDVFLWNSFNTKEDEISLPKLVEEDILNLRSIYLNWTTSLAETTVRKNSLAGFLRSPLLNGQSYWWQTLIADKCPYKTSIPYYIIRLYVFEKIYILKGYSGLIYVGDDERLADVLGTWLKTTGAGSFEWRKTSSDTKNNSVRKWDTRFRGIQAIAYLLFFIWTRLRRSRSVKPDPQALCTIATYFPGIDLQKAKKGEFYSNYWGPLHEVLANRNIRVNWVWIYTNLAQFSYKESIAFQSEVNASYKQKGNRFLLIEDFLDTGAFLSAVTEYIRIFYKSLWLRKVKKNFSLPGSRLNFFPLLASEWYESFRGHTAMINCLHMAAFHRVGKEIPVDTRLVLYVWENQPWEQCLLATREQLNKAKYIGVVHTPANAAIGNLKVFPGTSRELNTPDGRLMPDLIGAPGNIPKKVLIEGGWPQDRVVTIEALRYINSLSTAAAVMERQRKDEKNLLVITGSIYSETGQQLAWLSEADRIGALAGYTKVIIKPHPSLPVDTMVKHAGLKITHTIVSAPLQDLWEYSHVVYAANSTSVSIEAAYLGIPVIIAGASDNLNVNPLFGSSEVDFVYTAEQLSKKLAANLSHTIPIRNFLELTPELPRWHEIFTDALGDKLVSKC